MVDVLVELHLLNARVELSHAMKADARTDVLDRLGVDSSDYARTVEYYADRPDAYASLYGKVVDELTANRMQVMYSDSSAAAIMQSAPSP